MREGAVPPGASVVRNADAPSLAPPPPGAPTRLRAGGDADGGGAPPPRGGGRSLVLRRVLAVLLALAAAAAVLLTAHARRLGASLDARVVGVAGDPSVADDPSNAQPFEPFAFGVAGPVRGDAALLAASVEALTARGAAFVVLLGDVTESADDDDLRVLAASVRDRGAPVVAVAGPSERGERRAALQSRLGGARWWFVHRECLCIGLPGDADDAEFAARAVATARAPRRTIVLTTSPLPSVVAVAADAVFDPAPGARIVRVDADGSLRRERAEASGAPTLRSVVREASLGVVHPVARTGGGRFALLAGAAVLLAAAIRLALR